MKKWIFCLWLIFPIFLHAQEKEVMALIETNLGNMKIKLYNDTPIHRDNFIRLAKAGHYDGTLFYRVIKNFMIQGGSSDSRNAIAGQFIGFGKPMTIEAEIKPEHYHKKGALAAPRQPDRENFFKESDISQFYIVQGKKYTEQELEIIEKSGENVWRCACFLWVVGCNGQQYGTVYSWILSIFIRIFYHQYNQL